MAENPESHTYVPKAGHSKVGGFHLASERLTISEPRFPIWVSPLPALRGLIQRSLELGGFTAPRPLSSHPDVEGSHFPLNYLSGNQKR